MAVIPCESGQQLLTIIVAIDSGMLDYICSYEGLTNSAHRDLIDYFTNVCRSVFKRCFL
jgi:hypothetical protein